MYFIVSTYVHFNNVHNRHGIGIPVPIVAIAAGVAHDQYGHEDL